MCLYMVMSNTPVEMEGEAYKVMWKGKDGRYHSLYQGLGEMYLPNKRYTTLTDTIRPHEAGEHESYEAGFHCWTGIDVASAMAIEAATREATAGAYFKKFVVLRIQYTKRVALGVDNPFTLSPSHQFPCIVVKDMTILEEVELRTRKLPELFPLIDEVAPHVSV